MVALEMDDVRRQLIRGRSLVHAPGRDGDDREGRPRHRLDELVDPVGSAAAREGIRPLYEQRDVRRLVPAKGRKIHALSSPAFANRCVKKSPRRRNGDIRFKSKYEARENYHSGWRKSRHARTVKPAFGFAAGGRRRDTPPHASRCSLRRAPRYGCPHGSRAGASADRRDRDAELLFQRPTRSRGLALAGGKGAREALQRAERRRARRDPRGSGSGAENLAHGVPAEIAPRVLGHRVDLRIVPEERAETLRAGRIPARAVKRDGIGVFWKRIEGRWFVAGVLDGGPAAKAG